MIQQQIHIVMRLGLPMPLETFASKYDALVYASREIKASGCHCLVLTMDIQPPSARALAMDQLMELPCAPE